MGSNNNKHILFFVVLLFFLFLGEAHKHVRIINNMQSNVTIHCKSKDNDLGVHVLSHDDSFRWKFNVNFWQTTLFFCGFNSQHGRGVYDIFKADRDQSRCLSLCLWEVQDNGVHGFKENATMDDIWFEWQNNK
ncbi:Self-incomp_S1 domain-containing protein [Cephalotus follicularis]|uniref:S-protein homolog n=1 Tax=Cephalotus follicularis TaxID=3775 RepID=A0A1Q3BVM1_CEPFO|nr:Self-incomp_S1 domain-containing protein [Cephalotus follicularis]